MGFDRENNLNNIRKNSGFTLIEMIVSITIFAVIIIIAFDAVSNIGILRTRLSSRLDLNTEIYGATEKFIDIIKTGGDIDYEEYWNRKVVGATTMSGHYDVFSGFGNYGNGGSGLNYGNNLYYCASGFGIQMGSGGCTQSGPQRYGQYRQQFIDYNSNANGDGGDEDGADGIVGDDDDEDIGLGPSVFTGGTHTKELYLIKKGSNFTRTFFRWTLKQDPNGPPSASPCIMTGTDMGSGNCLGNIQVLKLTGKDLGIAHSGAVASSGRYDGVVDTWECQSDYNCILPTGIDSEWVNVFPDWVNVKHIHFFPYPEKDFRYAWKEQNDALVLNSYVRIQMTLGLAWERRKQIKGPPADMTITTSINLSR